MREQFACLIAISLLAALGCSGGPSDAPETVDVSGVVTLDGQPLPKASVAYIPADPSTGARTAYAVTDGSGDYTLELTASTTGIPPGQYQVQITTAISEDDESYAAEQVPVTYNRETTLTMTVPSDSYDFDLKSDAGEIVQETGEVEE